MEIDEIRRRRICLVMRIRPRRGQPTGRPGFPGAGRAFAKEKRRLNAAGACTRFEPVADARRDRRARPAWRACSTDLDDYRTRPRSWCWAACWTTTRSASRRRGLMQSAGGALSAAMPGIALTQRAATTPPAGGWNKMRRRSCRPRQRRAFTQCCACWKRDYAARFRRAIQLRRGGDKGNYGALGWVAGAASARTPRHAERAGSMLTLTQHAARWR